MLKKFFIYSFTITFIVNSCLGAKGSDRRMDVDDSAMRAVSPVPEEILRPNQTLNSPTKSVRQSPKGVVSTRHISSQNRENEGSADQFRAKTLEEQDRDYALWLAQQKSPLKLRHGRKADPRVVQSLKESEECARKLEQQLRGEKTFKKGKGSRKKRVEETTFPQESSSRSTSTTTTTTTPTTVTAVARRSSPDLFRSTDSQDELDASPQITQRRIMVVNLLNRAPAPTPRLLASLTESPTPSELARQLAESPVKSVVAEALETDMPDEDLHQKKGPLTRERPITPTILRESSLPIHRLVTPLMPQRPPVVRRMPNNDPNRRVRFADPAVTTSSVTSAAAITSSVTHTVAQQGQPIVEPTSPARTSTIGAAPHTPKSVSPGIIVPPTPDTPVSKSSDTTSPNSPPRQRFAFEEDSPLPRSETTAVTSLNGTSELLPQISSVHSDDSDYSSDSETSTRTAPPTQDPNRQSASQILRRMNRKRGHLDLEAVAAISTTTASTSSAAASTSVDTEGDPLQKRRRVGDDEDSSLSQLARIAEEEIQAERRAAEQGFYAEDLGYLPTPQEAPSSEDNPGYSQEPSGLEEEMHAEQQYAADQEAANAYLAEDGPDSDNGSITSSQVDGLLNMEEEIAAEQQLLQEQIDQEMLELYNLELEEQAEIAQRQEEMDAWDQTIHDYLGRSNLRSTYDSLLLHIQNPYLTGVAHLNALYRLSYLCAFKVLRSKNLSNPGVFNEEEEGWLEYARNLAKEAAELEPTYDVAPVLFQDPETQRALEYVANAPLGVNVSFPVSLDWLSGQVGQVARQYLVDLEQLKINWGMHPAAAVEPVVEPEQPNGTSTSVTTSSATGASSVDQPSVATTSSSTGGTAASVIQRDLDSAGPSDQLLPEVWGTLSLAQGQISPTKRFVGHFMVPGQGFLSGVVNPLRSPKSLHKKS